MSLLWTTARWQDERCTTCNSPVERDEDDGGYNTKGKPDEHECPKEYQSSDPGRPRCMHRGASCQSQ